MDKLNCRNCLLIVEVNNSEIETKCNCGSVFKYYENENELDKEYKHLDSYRKYRIKKGNRFYLHFNNNLNKPKFIFINKINDVIDKELINILFRGFSEELGQAIVLFTNELEITHYPNYPDDFLKSYLCEYCNNQRITGFCTIEKIKQVNAFLKTPNNKMISYHYCNNGNGGIHIQSPLYIDHKFVGLLITGAIRFKIKYDLNKITELIKLLNEDENNIDLLDNYEAQWYDKEFKEGVTITKEILTIKINTFQYIIEKIKELFNAKFTGSIRPNNRELINEIYKRVYPELSDAIPKYGISAFKSNFFKVFNLLTNDIHIANKILFYSNYMYSKTPNVFYRTTFETETFFEKSKNSFFTKDEILNDLFYNDDLFVWYPKDELTKIWFIDKQLRQKRKILFDYLNVNLLLNNPDFLCVAPITIDHKENLNALIILVGNRENVPYASESLTFFLYRFYDIMKFAMRIYYDQINKESAFKKICHDLRSKGGDLYTISNEIIERYNELFEDKITFKKKLEDISKLSNSLLEFSRNFDAISNSQFNNLNLFEYDYINFYNEIFLPLYQPLVKEMRSKYLRLEDEDFISLRKMPKVYVNIENFQRVFENILINLIKYSVPKTTFRIHWNDENDNFVKVEISNITIKLKDEEVPKLLESSFRGSNIKIIDKNTWNQKLSFLEGEGMGLNIVKELMYFMGGELEVKQSIDIDITNKKTLEYFYNNSNEYSKFSIFLYIPKTK